MIRRKELAYSYVAAGLTALAMMGITWGFVHDYAAETSSLAQIIAAALAVGALLYGSIVYQACRIGGLSRRVHGRRPARTSHARAGVVVLIPSYKEEAAVIRRTVFSAALQTGAKHRIVVLIDDPPHDTSGSVKASRAAVAKIAEAFQERAQIVSSFHLASRSVDVSEKQLAHALAALHRRLADWADRQVATEEGGDHAEKFFVEHILRPVSEEHRARAERLQRAEFSRALAQRELQKLQETADVEITSFERKTYENLSHAPNKAMNLNAYIGLMGCSYKAEKRGGKTYLVRASAPASDLSVPGAQYVLTLDADSMLLPEYIETLLTEMEADERLAVVQTPYSAFPNAATMLERIAGATTDIQYLVHQGFTYFNATYWVGANAIIRYAALLEIRATHSERGYQVPVFVQDRTVIEDTGSTIDLIRRGWKLHNHPERLAYSATPPDFGALVIQRRRWANGGLIILPDLMRYALSSIQDSRAWLECAIRVHYLISPLSGSLGIIALLVLAPEGSAASMWFPVAAAPYFWLYARDLLRCGYSGGDIFRVYALNLMLLPVNMAGVALSIRQIITGKKTPFGRTPKVESRTATQPLYITLSCGVPLFMLSASVFDMSAGNYMHALFAAGNAAVLSYGAIVFLGAKEMREDLRGAVAEWKGRGATFAPSIWRQQRQRQLPTAVQETRTHHSQFAGVDHVRPDDLNRPSRAA